MCVSPGSYYPYKHVSDFALCAPFYSWVNPEPEAAVKCPAEPAPEPPSSSPEPQPEGEAEPEQQPEPAAGGEREEGHEGE